MNDFGYVLISGLNFSCKQAGFTPGNDFITEPVPADAQTNTSDGIHTLFVSTTNTTANITIEATVAANLKTASWGTVTLSSQNGNQDITKLDLDNMTINKVYLVIGKYCWLRAKIQNFTAGTINLIKVSF